MRVSIVNCVSTAVEMMQFTDQALFANARHREWDYVIVKWLASPEVETYLDWLCKIIPQQYCGVKVHVVEHKTDSSVGYVPNLRAMINDGFNRGFSLNEYAGLTNTDLYAGEGWLRGLVKYAAPQRFITGLLLTPVKLDYPGRGFVDVNLGVPERETFHSSQFQKLRLQHCKDNLIYCQSLMGAGGYRQMCMIPYLFHRRWWRECGPWELSLNWNGHPFDKLTHVAPDMRFFGRMASAGCEFAMTDSCITYHHERVERGRRRPHGAEHLVEN